MGTVAESEATSPTARQPWVCPRCGAVNAPWVDRCGCTSVPVVPYQPPTPYYPQPYWPPTAVPWYPTYPIVYCTTTSPAKG
jgi:hypothetical protein